MANPAYETTPWADAATVTQHWADAPTTTTTRDRLLSVATIQARDYAPTLPVGTPVPDTYALAVIYQAADLWAAILRGDTDIIGVGDYALRRRPLSGTVRGLLRPETGLPPIG